MGQLIDGALEKNGVDKAKVRLILEDMTFPEKTIHRGWYIGQRNITYVEIKNCDLQYIDGNALNIAALHDLSSLKFENIPSLYYRHQMLNGLNNFGGLYLANTSVRMVKEAFLYPVKQFLTEFEFMHSILRHTLNKIFGSFRLFRLKIVKVCFCSNIRVLAKSNFTGLSAVQRLELNDCSIEMIQDNAFEYIGGTLTVLNLMNNKLKKISATSFNTVIELNQVMRTLGQLQFRGNPLECDCNMIELNCMLLMSFNEVLVKFRPYLACKDHFFEKQSNGSVEIQCPNLQKISATRLHLDRSPLETIAYPKFSLKLLDGHENLQIRTSGSRKFRVWIHENSNQIPFDDKRINCPKLHWLGASVTCTSFDSIELKQIPVARFMQLSQVTTICVHYLLHRGDLQFWPLSCISSIQTLQIDTETEEQDHSIQIYIGCILGGCIAGICLGTAYELYRIWRNKRAQQVEGLNFTR